MRRSLMVWMVLFALSGCASPVVDDPRRVDPSDPCALLHAGALDAARLAGPGVPGTASEGPRCEWRGQGRSVAVFTEPGALTTLADNSGPTTFRVRVAELQELVPQILD